MKVQFHDFAVGNAAIVIFFIYLVHGSILYRISSKIPSQFSCSTRPIKKKKGYFFRWYTYLGHPVLNHNKQKIIGIIF